MAIGRPAGAGARAQAWKDRLGGHALEGGIVKKSMGRAGSTLDSCPFGSIHPSGVAVPLSTIEITAEKANSQRLQSS